VSICRLFVCLLLSLLQVVEESLAGKRKLLLEKSQRLSLHPEAQQHMEEKEEGESSVDLIEDMMLLNEDAESSEEELAALRKHVQTFLSVLHGGQQEDMGEKDEQREAAELSVLLVGKLSSHQHVIEKLHSLVQSVSTDRGHSDTPLQYMLQLPIPVSLRGLIKVSGCSFHVHIVGHKFSVSGQRAWHNESECPVVQVSLQ